MKVITQLVRSRLILIISTTMGILLLSGATIAATANLSSGPAPKIHELNQRIVHFEAPSPTTTTVTAPATIASASIVTSAVTPTVKPITLTLILPDSMSCLAGREINLAGIVDYKAEAEVLIALYAAEYTSPDQLIDPCLMARIIELESGFDPGQIGADGELGEAQFLPSTFAGTPLSRYGLKSASHPAISIEAFAWMINQGRITEWTTLPKAKASGQ